MLVSASVLAGILLAGKVRVPGLPRFAVEDVHRFLGLLAGLFIAIHVGSIALDTVVPFSLSQLVIPFTSDYRPLATGLGVVAVELLIAVAMTNRLRSRLPYTVWRRAHYATLAVWLLATVHGILSGTDRSQTWLLAVYAHNRRAGGGRGRPAVRPRRHPATGRHRARRRGRSGHRRARALGAAPAGIELEDLHQRRRHDDDRPRSQRHPDRDDRPQRRLGHRLDQRHRRVAVGVPDRPPHRAASEVSDTALQLRFPNGTTCEGTLTALDDTGFTGTCTLPGGGTRTVTSTWTVSNGTVEGTISTTGGSSTSADA